MKYQIRSIKISNMMKIKIKEQTIQNMRMQTLMNKFNKYLKKIIKHLDQRQNLLKEK